MSDGFFAALRDAGFVETTAMELIPDVFGILDWLEKEKGIIKCIIMKPQHNKVNDYYICRLYLDMFNTMCGSGEGSTRQEAFESAVLKLLGGE